MSDLSGADFDARTGTVQGEGTLTLNGDRVRCIADIEPATLKGVGRLALVETADA